MTRTTRLAFALALAAVALMLPQAASARPAAEHPLALAAEDGNGDCPDMPVEESAGCEDLGAGDPQDGAGEGSWDVCDTELEPDCADDDDSGDDEAVEPTQPATVKVARRPVKVMRRTVTLTATCRQDEGCVAATYTLKLKAGKRLTRKARGTALNFGERAKLTFRLTRAQAAKLAHRTVKATVSAPGARTVSVKLHA